MSGMTERRFMQLLASYGADLSRWPASERDDAEMFLECGQHRVRDVWESEVMFDRLLALDTDAAVSPGLARAIVATLPEGQARVLRFEVKRLPKLVAGGALAASLAFGFAAGYAVENQNGPQPGFAQMLHYADNGAARVFLSAGADRDG